MSELTAGFESLPEEYQRVLVLTQDRYQIAVAPLQTLVGGWSGAMVFLVSVSWNESKRVEHCILKLDRKSKTARSDEVTRHNAVMQKSTPDFARQHIAELVFDRVEHEGAIAIFYRIAGQSLVRYRPLSNYERQSQLRSIFAETNAVLLDEWNVNPTFEQAIHPRTMLEKWLGFRLDAGGNIENFLQHTCRIDPDVPGLLLQGHVFPNPLSYARKPEQWGNVRSVDVATGYIHGDLNVNNILVKFSESSEAIDGYYVIDFALFKENMPLLYDQRYLEISYMLHVMPRISFEKFADFLMRLAVADTPDPHKVPIELSGMSDVIGTARHAFATWVDEKHPSLHDDLWGQYWLAGVAAGLAYTHKAGQSDEARLAGLIYAAANLRRYTTVFKLPLPTNIELLYDANQLEKGSPGTAKVKSPIHNLPGQPTPFIGRQTEMTAVKEILLREAQAVRLVTLTGPGGTGKTRLAIQVASELIDHFADGVYLVDLAPIREPEAVLAAIARTVGLKETSERPLLDEIKHQLQSRTMLLLLDNFEQVTSAAPLIGELIQDCPHLKLLITSREALHLRSEHIFPVPPLGLPLPDIKQQTMEQLTQYEAVRLFIERVLAVKPDFEVNNENAPAVAEICYRLDGLPLAIELAAARIQMFSPQSLLERVGSRLKLLRGGARDLPLRQQTLRDTIDWSYELLDHGDQRLFALLSVFASCTFEQVEMVAGGINGFDGIEMDILDRLTSLVDKSLIRQTNPGAGEPRLMMLETIREYAAERLEQDPEFSAAARRVHATYFADFTRRQWERLIGDGQEAAIREMETDIENVRTAWRYWVGQRDLGQLNKLVDSLWLLHDRRGWYHATVSLTNDLLDILASTPSTPERLQQQILLQTSLARVLLATKGYTEEVERAYARALELCEQAGEIPQLFPVLRGLASFYVLRMEHEKAVQMGERILQLAEHLGDAEMQSEGKMLMGYKLGFREGPQIALDYLERAIVLYHPERPWARRLGLGTNTGVVGLTVSALFLWMLGYPDRAYKRSSDSILLAQKLNHPYSITYALFHNGLLNVWLKNFEIAQERAQALLELSEKHGFRIWSAVGSCLRGTALAGMGRADEGLPLIEHGLTTYRGLRTPPVFLPLLLHFCAGAYIMASRPRDGLSLLNEAMEIGSASPDKIFISEVLVLKGDFILALSPADTSQAESWYQLAVENARDVRAPMLELRAAIRLSRVWKELGKPEQARKLLRDAYSKITEGLTTADLQEASTLLAELSE